MFTVAEGDVVRMTLENQSGEIHPMHLHGHHALVLSRNGVCASGSPWWVDSLDIASGDAYEIAFVADNPGIWMDHCHNLPHAAEGLVAHVAYTGFKRHSGSAVRPTTSLSRRNPGHGRGGDQRGGQPDPGLLPLRSGAGGSTRSRTRRAGRRRRARSRFRSIAGARSCWRDGR